MNNLYSDPAFHNGIASAYDAISQIYHDKLCTGRNTVDSPNVKGLYFCMNLLQSVYDSLTEEPEAIKRMNRTCDCGRHGVEPVSELIFIADDRYSLPKNDILMLPKVQDDYEVEGLVY